MLLEIVFIQASKVYAKRNRSQANAHRKSASQFVTEGKFRHAQARIELAEHHEAIAALYERVAVKLAEIMDYR